MSIKILTVEEALKTKKLAEEFGECFEMVQGEALKDYYCDNSGTKIPKGTQCASCLILPSKNHHNYEHQRSMLIDYIV